MHSSGTKNSSKMRLCYRDAFFFFFATATINIKTKRTFFLRRRCKMKTEIINGVRVTVIEDYSDMLYLYQCIQNFRCEWRAGRKKHALIQCINGIIELRNFHESFSQDMLSELHPFVNCLLWWIFTQFFIGRGEMNLQNTSPLSKNGIFIQGSLF